VFTTTGAKAAGLYAWAAFSPNGGGCPTSNDVLDGPAPQPSEVTITVPVTTTTNGPCGPLPPGATGQGNSSARCVLVEWRGSTLTNDYSQPKDNLTVIRLCDYTLGNCLDQLPRHP